MSKKLYSCTAIENLLRKYYEVGGDYVELEPGTLGYGTTVAFAPGYKCAVIKEVHINCWTSAHTVRFYNVMPKKYSDRIETWTIHCA